jgi:hypothetical protein
VHTKVDDHPKCCTGIEPGGTAFISQCKHFVVDKIQSLYQGRPASLQDFDTQVSLAFLDHYEDGSIYVHTKVDDHPKCCTGIEPGGTAFISQCKQGNSVIARRFAEIPTMSALRDGHFARESKNCWAVPWILLNFDAPK